MRYLLGRVCLDNGRLSRAVELFEQVLSSYTSSRAFWSIWAIQSHYYLARAYEQSRWYDRAAEQYRLYLEAREDADQSTPLVAAARAWLENRP